MLHTTQITPSFPPLSPLLNSSFQKMNMKWNFNRGRLNLIAWLLLMPLMAVSQPLVLSRAHGWCDQPFTLEIRRAGAMLAADVTVHYTTDGSEPTAASAIYEAPLQVDGNLVLRAAAFRGEERLNDISTATYLFIDDVLVQTNTPDGYPSTWGEFTQSIGTAVADYGMDEDMTTDAALRPLIAEGLKSLPVLSIVTDKDNLFSHENDPDKGGIYIFTGPPVGDSTGHGWTRPISLELMGGPQKHNLTTTCGIRLHGGHGRLAEKNPKHSFRLVFKQEYGNKTLKYPVFGSDQPSKFDQLVLRCHFGNSWQHWMESNRGKAQYTRDVWARCMQQKMGGTGVNALYVHVFLNGMYWGLYNIAERVDGRFGASRLGGEKDDIDVIKIEEDGGNHHEASEGDMEAWELRTATAAKAADPVQYNRLQGKDADGNDSPDLEALLDIDAFIDYMLINQYGGNTDWDHHNWYAMRRRGEDSQGFRFLCWDSELILDNVSENVLSKNNGNIYPTGIFQNLLQNEDFARRYLHRAKEVLADDGLLGEESAVAVWDSLYNTISSALYAEAARWGDYRHDVDHSTSQVYTVDGTYMTERNRLLTQYFPFRSGNVLNSIVAKVSVDDFELPDGWVRLASSMFKEWDGHDPDAQPTGSAVNVDWNMRKNAGGGVAVAGFGNVEYNRYADVSVYEKLVLRGSGNRLRILANRLVDHGPWKQIVVSFNESDPYWDSELQAIVLPLEDLMTVRTSNDNQYRLDDFVHLHALKVDWNNSVNLQGAYLVLPPELTAIEDVKEQRTAGDVVDDNYYNLNGQVVTHPTRGIYIHRGKKVYMK